MSGAAAELDSVVSGATTGGRLDLVLAAVRQRISRADLIGASLAVVLSMLAAAWSLQLWNAHLHVPFQYESDGLLTLGVVKSAISSGGWVYTNHFLGAPFGLQWYDFPLATDNLNYLAMKLISLVTSDPAKVMNLFFLLTFPATALVGYIVLRWLKLSVATAVVCAVLFADSPYHLLRGEAHLLLSDYVSVPIGMYLIVSVLEGRPLWRGQIRSRQWRTLLCWRNLFILILCMAIGSLGIYYAVFTVLIIGLAGLAFGLRTRSWLGVVQAAAVIVAIGGTAFLNNLPATIYREEHGANQVVAVRHPEESEIYGLKLAEMMLPVPGHRIGALAHLRNTYDTTTPVPSEDGQQSLGIVSSLGLSWIFLIGLSAIIGVGGGFSTARPWFRRQRQLAFIALVAFVLGTIGGFSALIAYIITPEIRSWNRISIFIMFASLAVVGLGLDALARRWLRGRRASAAAGLAALLVIGIIDQSTRNGIPPYEQYGITYGSDGQFASAIQRMLPAGASVFQLPYMPFPETPAQYHMNDYDPLRGYVNSTNLHWSYPTMAGRPQDWDSQTTSLPPVTLLDGLVAAGFRGLWIDRWGYQDMGAEIEREIAALLGPPPLVSRDGRFEFYDLSAYAAQLRARYTPAQLAGLRRAILHPAQTMWASGFYTPEPDGTRWAPQTATATVTNSTGKPQQVEFFSIVESFAPQRYTLTITAPNGQVGQVPVSHSPQPVHYDFTLPPGKHTITFRSSAPNGVAPGDPRLLSVHYGQPAIDGVGMAPFFPIAG
ncbi:MAG: hypothetical protein ACYDHH_01550 [Solirubrobacteraceae bacterium]